MDYVSNVGSFIFDVSGGYQVNHIVLGKWDNGGDSVTFKDLKIVRLDNQVDTVHEVNDHFIKKAVDDNLTHTFTDSQKAVPVLWHAFLYRGYDYYFDREGWGLNKSKVKKLFKTYLTKIENEIKTMVSCYQQDLDLDLKNPGSDDPDRPCPTNKRYPFDGFGLSQCSRNILQLNHTFVNSLQAHLLIAYAISDYLDQDQKNKLQEQDTDERRFSADSFKKSVFINRVDAICVHLRP